MPATRVAVHGQDELPRQVVLAANLLATKLAIVKGACAFLASV